MKKIIVCLVVAMILMMCVSSIYANEVEKYEDNPTIFISGKDDILLITEDNVISNIEEDYNNIFNNTIQPMSYVVTYKKTITIFAIHELSNPGFSDWPQTVWYIEESPIGTTASGDLFLKKIEKIPGQGSQWYLTYSGTLSYLHP